MGDGGICSLPDPDLRGGGYVSPRASAAALRLSVSTLLGRPRLRGGSPPAELSSVGDSCAEAPLSLLHEAVLAGGRGWMARGIRGFSDGYRGRLRRLGSIGADGPDPSGRGIEAVGPGRCEG